MKRTLLLALVLAPLFVGCSFDLGDTDESYGGLGHEEGDTEDRNQTDDDVGNGADGHSSDDSTTGTVIAQAPNQMVGDFYFGEALSCHGVNSCEADVVGTIEVSFICPTHLFLTKSSVVDPGNDQYVEWTNPGDWGLAPSGTYRDEADQYEGQATTKVVGDHIELHWDGNVLGIVKGSTFSGVDGIIEYSNGVISDDLKTITYHAFNGEKQWDTVLKLVE